MVDLVSHVPTERRTPGWLGTVCCWIARVLIVDRFKKTKQKKHRYRPCTAVVLDVFGIKCAKCEVNVKQKAFSSTESHDPMLPYMVLIPIL